MEFLPLYSDNGSVTVSRSVVSDPLLPHRLQCTRLLCPYDSTGKKSGVGSHSLLQGIFLTQRSNPGLPHYRQILYHLSQQGSLNPMLVHNNKICIKIRFSRWLSGKESACQFRRRKRRGSIPGLGRSSEEGNGNSLH